ncbi:MAG: hypothetical protein AAGI48_17440 [Verrucomicrobiota bacterium]
MKSIPVFVVIVASLVLLVSGTSSIRGQEEGGPLYLVISEVGNKLAMYGDEDELRFTLMAEIEGKLGFSLSGRFEEAEIIEASTVAPDGDTYKLKAVGNQPRADRGLLTRHLSVAYGDTYTDFSIGSWKVVIRFKIDGHEYTHQADYLITWRKPDEGIWGMQKWVNVSLDPEEGVAGETSGGIDPVNESEVNPASETEDGSDSGE